MGRNTKKKKFPEKQCISKNVFKEQCSGKRIYIKPALRELLKKYELTANKNSRICVSCQINVRKGAPTYKNAENDTDTYSLLQVVLNLLLVLNLKIWLMLIT